jgi:hypothetical protein
MLYWGKNCAKKEKEGGKEEAGGRKEKTTQLREKVSFRRQEKFRGRLGKKSNSRKLLFIFVII